MKSRVFNGDKASKGTTLKDYGVTDAYTKVETDKQISNAVTNAVATAKTETQTAMHTAGYRVISWSTITVAASAWDASTKKATVNVAGVKPDSSVMIAYAGSSRKAFLDAGIYGVEPLGEGTVTLGCETVPTESVGVNIEVKN